MVERIKYKNEEIAIIIKKGYEPEALEFLTPENYNQQLGIMKCIRGKIIQSHTHKPIKREVIGTSEAIFICSGKVEVYLFNNKREKIATRILTGGDAIFLINGGHGFKMLEDSVLLEIKQGPYLAEDDKERF
jgi:hypothetical protein